MNNKCKLVLVAAILCLGTATFAGPRHHRHHNEGLALANGIVDLVLKVVAPQPVVVAPQPVVVTPQPVVVTPQPVVVTPQPVVVAPQPVVVTPRPVYYRRPAPPPPPPRRNHHRRPPHGNPRGGHRGHGGPRR